MPEWTQRAVRDWIVLKCWQEHLGKPAGVGLMLQPSDLSEDDPSWAEILRAMEYLLGKYEVDAEYGRAMGSQGPIFVSNLRLTQFAIVKIEDAIEEKGEGWEVTYIPD